MNTHRRSPQALLSLFVVLSLVLTSLPAGAGAQESPPVAPEEPSLLVRLAGSGAVLDATTTYRLQVTLSHPRDPDRVRQLGVTVLAQDEDAATVLATDDQLENLARLGFQPRGADQVAMLLGASRVDAGATLAEATLLPLQSQDTDEDGLTDTEEAWWCTDAGNPDSDGDLVEDGQEVSQLLAGNRTNGKPFLGWPPNIPGCFDDDFDSIPDLAEGYVVGLSVNRESSDLDKYDDGQEFFGSTYCPGGPGSCGYGALPRTVDLYLGSNMPSFVQVPGNSPWIAAFPDPTVTVVDGSLSVEAVTTITTDHTIGEGESHAYSTSTTRGTSTSNVDLETWNDWQEVEDESGESQRVYLNPRFQAASMAPDGLSSWLKIGGGTLALVGGAAFVGCVIITGGACAVAAVVATAGGAVLGGVSVYEGAKELAATDPATTSPDTVQAALQPRRCSQAAPGNYTCIPDHVADQQEQDTVDLASVLGDTQDHPSSESDTQYTHHAGDTLESEESHSGEIPLEQNSLDRLGPVTHAAESGGIKGTITTEYSETSVTTSQEFSSYESWSEATAVNTAHAADLRFTYSIKNDGTDIIREMDGLLFNIYLGSDPNPIYTYNAIAQTGTLSNIQPGQELTFAANPVPLTLQQMAQIDQGTTFFVTLEHLSYGGDQVFFQDAINGGLIVGIEDGYGDGDSTLDPYVLPCFGNPCGADPNETVQVIVQRGFPTVEDAAGNLLSMSTPEINGTQATWVEHQLSYTSWWNVYYGEGIDYSGGLSTTMPVAGGAVVLRFLDDTDLDGYNDRTETKLGTDPDDAGSHPEPELLAGSVSQRTGDDVTVQMAFLNTGPYDATGVEVVAYAPDETITIDDNVIGGGGRVGSAGRVLLGGRVRAPVLGTGWSGTAVPSSGGQYAGNADKEYTVTAASSGSVGSGNLVFDWTDGVDSGQLQFGDGYLSPTPLAVGSEGVLVSLNTGAVTTGDSFTVRAHPPRDTISYTINSEPFTLPVFILSYNDPQGNHKFSTPISLTDTTEELAPYSGQMLEDIGLSIVTDAAFDEAGTNTTYYVVNNPNSQPVVDSHLFVEYIDASGTVTVEQVFTRTLQPGPNVWPVTWDTSMFTGTFGSAADDKVLAFWTDSQGNVIDTAVRHLSLFKADPLPQVATSGLAWDFGAVERGTVVQHEVTVANEGRNHLYTWGDQGGPARVRLDAQLDKIPPSDQLTYDLLLDTSDLPAGPFSQTVAIRTSDPHDPALGLAVTGQILSPTLGVVAYEMPWQPWDQRVFVEGPRSQGDRIELAFTPDAIPDRLEPMGLYDYPAKTHLGDGEVFDPQGFSVARLVTGTKTIRMTMADTFTNGHSYLVPFGYEFDSPIGEESAFSVTVPHEDYDEVRVQVESPSLGIYDGFEGSRWKLQRGYNNDYDFTSQARITTDQADNYLELAVHGEDSNSRTTSASAISVWDLKDSGVSRFEFTEYVYGYAQWSTSYTSVGLTDESGHSVEVYRSLDLFHTGWTGHVSGSDSYTGTIVFHHDTDTADFYKDGQLVSSGIDLSGFDAYKVYFTSHVIPDHDTASSADALHRVFWTKVDDRYYDDFEGSRWKLQPGYNNDYDFTSQARITTDQADNYLELAVHGEDSNSRTTSASAVSVWDLKDSGVSRFEFTEYVYGYAQWSTSYTSVGLTDESGHSVEVYRSLDLFHTGWTGHVSGSDSYTGTIVFHHDADTADFYEDGQLVSSGIDLSSFDAYKVYFTSHVIPDHDTASSADALHRVFWTRAYGSPTSVMLALGASASAAWESAVPNFEPFVITSCNLAPALNDYLTSQPDSGGMVPVPMTMTLTTAGPLYLTSLVLTPTTPISSDVGLTVDDLTALPVTPTEGDTVVISATLHNDGSEPTAPFVASFLHGDGATGTLLGGAFVDALAAGGDTTVSMPWDTTGYTGTQTLTVIADPYDHLVETDEGNNQASTTVTVLTKPDLRITSLIPSEAEVVEGQSISVTAVVSNTGQTAAPASTLALYAGTVATGTLVDSAPVAVSAGAEVPVDLSWTAATVGPQLLSSATDTDDVVLESQEDNNEAQASVYVGWGSPVYVDAGGDPDPTYSAELGYGLLSAGTSVVDTCGSLPYQTYRRGVYGQPLEYRFDHLLTGRYYHLDTVMSLCSGQRQQHLWIDGLHVAGPLTVTASAPLRHSLLLEPASYTDHSIIAGVTAEGIASPVVAELTLTEIDYCYRDSGSLDNDPAWSPGYRCGYQDPTSQRSNIWGDSPTQTVRFDDSDDDVVYRFSDLFAGRMYAVNLTLYEGDGAGRQETVRIDGVTVGPTVTLSSEPQHLVVPIPAEAYESDGVVDVAIVETTGWNAPVVSEIALEEQTVVWWDDDLDGPAIATPSFSDTVPSDAPLLVTVDIRDEATGGHGVSGATLYYGYDAPYDQNQVPGTGPGGNGDGPWTFEIPAQGAGHEGQTLWFWLTARDGDDSPATSSDTNGGTYYAVSVEGQWFHIYLPLLMRE